MSKKAALHLWGIEARSAGPRGKNIHLNSAPEWGQRRRPRQQCLLYPSGHFSCLLIPGLLHLVSLWARVWSGRGTERTRAQKRVWGGAIRSRARTRTVVIWVPARMINETFWGQRKFLFCWGPEDQGSRAGCIYRSLEGSGCRVHVPFPFVPSRSSHDLGVFPLELGFWYLE